MADKIRSGITIFVDEATASIHSLVKYNTQIRGSMCFNNNTTNYKIGVQFLKLIYIYIIKKLNKKIKYK